MAAQNLSDIQIHGLSSESEVLKYLASPGAIGYVSHVADESINVLTV